MYLLNYEKKGSYTFTFPDVVERNKVFFKY